MFLTEKQKELVKAESYIKSVELYEVVKHPGFHSQNTLQAGQATITARSPFRKKE
jgi:hypothetical protein